MALTEAQILDWQMRNQRAAERQARRDAQQQQARNDALSLEYQRQQDMFRQDVENRYLDILAGRVGTRDRVLEDIAGYGQSLKDDADENYNQLRGDLLADVYSRGLGGSPSMLAAAKRTAADARDRQMNRVQDQLIDRRTRTDERLSDELFSFMERRNDVPPDLNQLIQLQRGLGASGPLMGGLPGAGAFGRRGTAGGFDLGGPQQPSRLPVQGGPLYGGFDLAPIGGRSSASQGYFPLPRSTPPVPIRRNLDGGQGELARRQAMLSLYNARNPGSGSTSAFGRQDAINEAQRRAIAGGFADWAPGQPAPVIPGMTGGPIGVGGSPPLGPVYIPPYSVNPGIYDRERRQEFVAPRRRPRRGASTGRTIGNFLGGAIGGPAGSYLGGAIGGLFS